MDKFELEEEQVYQVQYQDKKSGNEEYFQMQEQKGQAFRKISLIDQKQSEDLPRIYQNNFLTSEQNIKGAFQLNEGNPIFQNNFEMLHQKDSQKEFIKSQTKNYSQKILINQPSILRPIFIHNYNQFDSNLSQIEQNNDDFENNLENADILLQDLQQIDQSLVENEVRKMDLQYKQVYDEVYRNQYEEKEKPFFLNFQKDFSATSKVINNDSLNIKKCTEQPRWFSAKIISSADYVKLVVSAPQNIQILDTIETNLLSNSECIYEAVFDKEGYEKMCKEQSILLSFQEFPKRLAQLIDLSILNPKIQNQGQYSCVINESESDPGLWVLYLCEQIQYKIHVHFKIQLKQIDGNQRSFFLFQEKKIVAKLAENYFRQKIFLLGKHRENCFEMLDINLNLKQLQKENTLIIQNIKEQHQIELDNVIEQFQQKIQNMKSEHEIETKESIQNNQEKENELTQQIRVKDSNIKEFELQLLSEKNLVSQHLRSLDQKNQQIEQLNIKLKEISEENQISQERVHNLEKEEILHRLKIEQLQSQNENQSQKIQELNQNVENLKNHNQNLQIQETKLDEQLKSEQKQIENHLQIQEKLQNELSNQQQQTKSQKEAKQKVKLALQQSQDKNQDLENEIQNLNNQQNVKEKEIEELNLKIQKFEQNQSILESKLIETQNTLISNNETITELKQNLAQAQKSSFQMLISNNGGNQIKNKSISFHTSNMQTGFENKISNSSKGKYIVEKQQDLVRSQMTYQNDENKQYENLIKDNLRRESEISIRDQEIPKVQLMQNSFQHQNNKSPEIQKYEIAQSQLSMPLTEFYLNKYSIQETANNQQQNEDQEQAFEQSNFIVNQHSQQKKFNQDFNQPNYTDDQYENKYMVKAKQLMVSNSNSIQNSFQIFKRQNEESPYKKGFQTLSFSEHNNLTGINNSSINNSYAQQLQRDRILASKQIQQRESQLTQNQTIDTFQQ